MKKTIRSGLCLLLAAVLLFSLSLTVFAAKIGDVDGDGKVTAADARLALRRAVDLEDYEEGSEKYIASDADRDGKVTAADARLILRAAVGLENLDIIVPPSPNGYDMLRSKTLTLDGTMTENGQTTPMKMAIDGSGGMYAASDFDGMPLGIYLKDGKITMISDEKKIYTTFSASMIPGLDISDSEILNGFADLPDLSQANEMISTAFNGVPCKGYVFTSEQGKMIVYMDGTTLLGLYRESPDGSYSVLRVNSVSDTFPTIPPKGYKYRTTLLFFAALGLSMTDN